MMLRAHTCAHARASSWHDAVRLLSAIRAVGCERGRPPGAFTRRRPYMPLCTRSEVYIRLVCPGIGLSQGAADDARRQGAGQVSQPTQLVVNLLSKGLWVGLSLTPHECAC